MSLRLTGINTPPQSSSRRVPANLTHISYYLCVDKLLDRLVALWQNDQSDCDFASFGAGDEWRGRLNCGYTESRSIITPFVRSFSDTDKIFSFRCVHILVWILVRAIALLAS